MAGSMSDFSMFESGSDDQFPQDTTDYSLDGQNFADDFTGLDILGDYNATSTPLDSSMDTSTLFAPQPQYVYPAPQAPYFLPPPRPHSVVPMQPRMQTPTPGAPLGHPFALYSPHLGFYYPISVIPKHSVMAQRLSTPAPYSAVLPSHQQQQRQKRTVDDRDDGTPVEPKRKYRKRAAEPAAVACTCPQSQKVPRPQNCFFLYRSLPKHQALAAKLAREAHQPAGSQRYISQAAAVNWKQESAAVKREFKLRADKLKAEHATLYPDYRYRPNKSGGEKVGRTSGCRGCNAGATGGTFTDSSYAPKVTPTAQMLAQVTEILPFDAVSDDDFTISIDVAPMEAQAAAPKHRPSAIQTQAPASPPALDSPLSDVPEDFDTADMEELFGGEPFDLDGDFDAGFAASPDRPGALAGRVRGSRRTVDEAIVLSACR
ncbi:slightly ste11-like protein [Teratosphaeriaceae sp. CCFEE 6253]|nr:slightly ste11-like protein [Teratosphaeriaceae sp. CCFEE 6253]